MGVAPTGGQRSGTGGRPDRWLALRRVAFGVLGSWLCALGAEQAMAGPVPADERTGSRQQELLDELYLSLKQVDRSIEVTKEIIKRSEKRSYLPDLLLRLAELHAEKSRYLFLVESEKLGGSRIVVSPEAKLVKERAIALYSGILTEFPRYPRNDQVLFFLAHEYRELGQYDEMVKAYQRLADQYPDSEYRLETRLILGDYQFDRGELAQAEGYYNQILAAPASPVHQMARYKLAWIRFNQEKMKEALELFQQVVRTNRRADGADGGTGALVDVRREALIDMVLPFTEVQPAEVALGYFEPLTLSRAELAMVLDKLGNRYFLQQKWPAAAAIYRRLAEIGFDGQRLAEYVQRIFHCVAETKDLSQADRDVRLLARAWRRHGWDWRYPAAEQEALARQFEELARDVATRLHDDATRTGNRHHAGVAANAYQTYLELFPDSPHGLAIRQNLGEALAAAGRPLEAAGVQEQVALQLAPGAEREEAAWAAVASYYEALKEAEQLSPLKLLRAQEGLKAAGARFVENYPNSQRIPGVRFNIARLHYEQGHHAEAVALLRTFVESYPTLPEAPAAGHMALDALSQLERLEELVALGRTFTANLALPQSFRDEVQLIIQGKSRELVEAVAVAAGAGPQAAASGDEQLLAFATQHGGNPIGEVALLNAFSVYREKGKLRLMDEAANRFLREYPNSPKAQELLLAQAKTYLQVGRFEQAAQAFEAFGTRYPQDAGSFGLLHRAIRLYRALGEHRRVVEVSRLLRQRQDPGFAQEIRPLMVEALVALEDWAALEPELGSTMALPEKAGSRPARKGSRTTVSAADQEVALTLAQAAIRQGNALRARELLRTAKEGEDVIAAQALFRGMELDLEQLVRIRIGLGVEAEQALGDKLAVLDRLEGTLSQLVEKAVGEWIIAGLLLVGQAYLNVAETLAQAPVPPAIPEADRAAYREALAEQVAGMQARARESFSTCSEKAHELNVFTRYLVGCLHEGKLPPPDRLPGRAHLPEASLQQREQLEQVLAQSPKDGASLLRLADLYLKAGDFRMARLLAAQALEFDDASGQARNRVALASLMLNEPSAAIFDFEAAVVQGAENEARLNLATLYYLYGDTERARATAREVKGLARMDLAAPGIHPMAGYALQGMGLR